MFNIMIDVMIDLYHFFLSYHGLVYKIIQRVFFNSKPAKSVYILQIGASRLKKSRGKRLAMLTSWKNVLRTFFIQISAAITVKIWI